MDDYYAFEGGVVAVPSPNIPISKEEHAAATAALASGGSVSILNGFEIVAPLTLASLSPGRNVGVKPTDVVDLHVDALLARRMGYAEDVVGGLEGDVWIVDTLADSGPTSLREALACADPLWIVPVLPGVIDLQANLNVTSYKTVDGRAAVIRLRGKPLYISNVDNLILCNFEVTGSDNDGVRILGSDLTWCVNLSLSNCFDGLIDITSARSDAPLSRHTITACKMTLHDKCSLIGLHEALNDDRIRVTFSRNYMECGQRHPRVAKGRVHAINNLVRYSRQGMQCYDGGQLLSQGNWFHRLSGDAYAHDFTIPGYPNGYVSSGSDVVTGGAIVAENQIGLVAWPGYAYIVAAMGTALRDQIASEAGAVLTL